MIKKETKFLRELFLLFHKFIHLTLFVVITFFAFLLSNKTMFILPETDNSNYRSEMYTRLQYLFEDYYSSKYRQQIIIV